MARVLIIAGSDSSGGAGIQADTKTVTVLGGYAATAITALTAQNTQGVQAIEPAKPKFVSQQIKAVLEDIGADSIKLGMLCNAEIIKAIVQTLQEKAGDIPIILDPVMVASSGDRLLETEAVELIRNELLPMATIITPNIPELEVLSSQDKASKAQAAKELLSYGAKAVLVKGGHEKTKEVEDWLFTKDQEICFRHLRIDTRHTHGTGCTLASAIATYIAQGKPIEESVEKAFDYVHQAIKHAPGLGQGHGPLGHGWCIASDA